MTFYELPSFAILIIFVDRNVAKLQEEWVENADRWVAGFLEKFEEGCHSMGTAIKERIQERLKSPSMDFTLLQYDGDEYEEDEDDDEDVKE
ncbi:hypothetical protein ABZP36_031439 [Zizania latifolia]